MMIKTHLGGFTCLWQVKFYSPLYSEAECGVKM